MGNEVVPGSGSGESPQPPSSPGPWVTAGDIVSTLAIPAAVVTLAALHLITGPEAVAALATLGVPANASAVVQRLLAKKVV